MLGKNPRIQEGEEEFNELIQAMMRIATLVLQRVTYYVILALLF
jgi:hypothetical protein